MAHIVLLGDSVFDNATYVARDQDVLQILRDRLQLGWHATLLAKDGAVLTDVRCQVERVPPEGTHLIVSAGGNDALGEVGVFEESVARARFSTGAATRSGYERQSVSDRRSL